jgi:hypothetical protein
MGYCVVDVCPVVTARFLKDAWRERERGALQQAGLEEPKAWYLPDLRERRIQVRTEGGKKGEGGPLRTAD